MNEPTFKEQAKIALTFQRRWLIAATTLIVLLAGNPDLLDAIIHYLAPNLPMQP